MALESLTVSILWSMMIISRSVLMILMLMVQEKYQKMN